MYTYIYSAGICIDTLILLYMINYFLLQALLIRYKLINTQCNTNSSDIGPLEDLHITACQSQILLIYVYPILLRYQIHILYYMQ